MSITIPDPVTGEPVEVFIRLANGYMDAICRATDQAAWEAACIAYNLADADGNLRDGVHVDVLGPVVITPGTYDADGAEITPPTFDERYHVNLRVAEDRDWQAVCIAWMQHGDADPEINRDEVALVYSGVSLIDPDTIHTPVRVWLPAPSPD